MAYRYETHMHTSQGSLCGASTGREHARFYKEMGYTGIIITDHFFGGNTAAPRTGPWKQRIEAFCAGYEDALAEGQRIGLDVFFGWEEAFQGDEYLIYGLDKQWMIDHPEMETWTRREQLEAVHRDGGCVIQAHPFRDRSYIPRILLARQFADGIEIANAGNLPYNDAYAAQYAKEYGLLTIAGSDNHNSASEKWQQQPLMGIETQERLRDIHDLVRLVRSRGCITPLVPAGRMEEGLRTAPPLDSYWLSDNELPVLTERRWLEET